MKLHEELFEKIKKLGYYERIYKDLIAIRESFKNNKEKVLEDFVSTINKSYLENSKDLKDIYKFLLYKLALSTDKIGELSLPETQYQEIEELASKYKFYGLDFIYQNTREDKLLELREIDIDAYKKMKKNLEIYDELIILFKSDEELEDFLERKIEEILRNRRIEEVAKEIFG